MTEYVEPKTKIDAHAYQLLVDFGQAVAQRFCQDCGRSTDRLHVTENPSMPRTICEMCSPAPKGERFVRGAMPLNNWLSLMLLPTSKEEFLGKWSSFLVTPGE